jgi:UDP-N-acetylglucosamine 2-epimerase (non-hydrolysing)
MEVGMEVLHVAGARPNFMKVAPVMAALEEKSGIRQVLLHTGQHYDKNMSEIFFRQLGLPTPDINLEVGSGSHAAQTAQIMTKIEAVLSDKKPDMVLVYGDVNSTVAATLVCAKLLIPVAHVEAGLRSFDRTMPEEINRIVTDQLAEILFTPSIDGDENLLREGIHRERIHLVGNVMIDTLVRLKESANALHSPQQVAEKCNVSPGAITNGYGLVTLHRPSNVDDPIMLSRIIDTLLRLSHDLPLLFPIHPRTRNRLKELGIHTDGARLFLVDPVGYLEFLSLQQSATVVITDSGGIQEETTYLGIPCLTVRENTERPVTVTLGTNVLVGQDMNRLRKEVFSILNGDAKRGTIPPLWGGGASERVADILCT